MSKLRIFLTLTGYQLTWLACVFGQIKFNIPLLGIYIGLIFVLLYFYFSKNRIKFLKLCLLISLPGYLFDTVIVYFAIYEFKDTFIFGTIPLWMLVLWPSFSTLYDEILVFLKKYKFFGIILSCIIGPFTYYLGEPLEVIKINNYVLFFLTMISFWGLLMFYYLEIILKRL